MESKWISSLRFAMPFMLLISSLELGCDRLGTVSKCGILIMQVLRGAELIPAARGDVLSSRARLGYGAKRIYWSRHINLIHQDLCLLVV